MAILAIAALHGVFYIWYQRPDWYTQWTDQDGYRKLAAALATTGRFTRYPDSAVYVPEVLRTPGYPAFLAVIYLVFGLHQMPVAVAQTGLFMAICVVVYAIGREIADRRIALAGAAATALYLPIPYFGALVMTEVLATLCFTLSIWLCLRARRHRQLGAFIAAGAAMAITALVRPAFALFPFLIFATSAVVFARRRLTVQWIAGAVTTVVVLSPWLAYNYIYLHRFTMSGAGGLGRATWEGTWHGRWSGRVQGELTEIADSTWDRMRLDERVRAFATLHDADPAPMLDYVHQWQDIRRIWTEPTDSVARINARVRADDEYMRVGFENIRRDPIGHVKRRLTRGLFLLWAAEIPVRYSDINSLPPSAITAMWVAQALVVALAGFGLVHLALAGMPREAAVLATPFVYITVVHLPLLTEARQSLPADPTLVLLAVCGASTLWHHFTSSPTPEHGVVRA